MEIAGKNRIAPWMNGLSQSQRIKLYMGEKAMSRSELLRSFFKEVVTRMIFEANIRYSSRKRKTIESYIEEGKRRGFEVEEIIGNNIVRFTRGGFSVFLVENLDGRYLQREIYVSGDISEYKVRVEADRFLDLVENIQALWDTACSDYDRLILEIKKDLHVIRMSLPLIREQFEGKFGPRGYKYFLKETKDGIILYVNIIGNNWLEGTVSIENMETVMSLTPYFLKRPDDIKVLGGDFRIVLDARIKRQWEYYMKTP